jgi:hypothetical protein
MRGLGLSLPWESDPLFGRKIGWRICEELVCEDGFFMFLFTSLPVASYTQPSFVA